MALPARHIIHQGGVIASLGGTAIAALRQRLQGTSGKPLPETPGPEIATTVQPLPADLIRDYIRHVGGDPGAYRGTVPPHLFPQWGFPLAAKTLRGLPYPLMRVLNGGCRLEVNSPLPMGERLNVKVRLEEIDESDRRVVLHQRIATGTGNIDEAVVGHLYAIVPLGGGEKPDPKEKAKRAARVPDGAREVTYWKIPDDAGLAFAMLTGDFNPVHWVRPYARASGFRGKILHGFATMARAIEGLNRKMWSGGSDHIRVFDCRFTRPLVLPARVGLYVRGGEVYVGDAPGGPAYLTGTCETKGAKK